MLRFLVAFFLCLGVSLPALAQTATLLTAEDQVQGADWDIGFYGVYTGTQPSSVTSASWNGCGGGAATITGFHTTGTDPGLGMRDGAFLVNARQPSTQGSCSLTITTNLGETSTSPALAFTGVTTGPEVVSQVHNAPGWLHSHAYSPASGPKTRVLNGPGWVEGTGTWVPGQLLNAYELTSAACTSGGSGPSGTGNAIPDGSCTWKYLSVVDYISLTGWLLDAIPWVNGKTYATGESVSTNVGGVLRSYLLTSNVVPTWSGEGQSDLCTSTVAPSFEIGQGRGYWYPGRNTLSDGCAWYWRGNIGYSSQQSGYALPTITYTSVQIPPWSHAHLTRDYRAQLWNDREYVAGSNGENNPISTQDHQAFGRNWEPYLGCPGITFCHYMTIEPAAGEGFKDSMTTSTPLVGYDPTKGVAIRNPNTVSSIAQLGTYGLSPWDGINKWSGLQVKSEHASAIWSGSNQVIVGNIIDGGYPLSISDSWGGTVADCCSSTYANNLIINHGPTAIAIKYGRHYIIGNTIVNAGDYPDANATSFNWGWLYGMGILPVFANNAFYGFKHMSAYCLSHYNSDDPATQATNYTFDASSAHNITNTPAPDDGFLTNDRWCDDAPYTVAGRTFTMPGTTYGANASQMFVAPGSDWRPGPALIGAGAGYGSFILINGPLSFDTPDILGNTRPTGSQWTVGAEQSNGAPPAFTLTGNTISNSTFTEGLPASTVIGAVTVNSIGTPSGTTTLSLTGANAQGFRLSTSAYPGANLICPVAGCPLSTGPFTDLNLVATNSSAAGSPFSSALSITGIAGYSFNSIVLPTQTFPQSGAASTVIGHVQLNTTGTPVGTTTLSLVGANAFAFRLSSTSMPADLICPAFGCPAAAGPITDLSIRATNTSAVGSPVTSASLSLVGIGAPTAIRLKRGRHFVGGQPTAPAPYTFTGNSLGGSTSASFLQGADQSTVIGAVNVATTGTPAGSIVLSLEGANAQAFRLSSTSLPANLLCPATNCPNLAGPISDVTLVATDASAVGNPRKDQLFLTGTAPFTFIGNSLSSNLFPQGGVATTRIGFVAVGSTGIPTGTTTLSLTGANAQGFRLDSSTYAPNSVYVICPSGGCPSSAGPFTDVNLVATNSAAVGSPKSTALSLTGLSNTCTWTGNIITSCLPSNDLSDQIIAPRPGQAGQADTFAFGAGQALLVNGNAIDSYGANCDAMITNGGTGNCGTTAQVTVCATPGDVPSNGHPWSLEGVISWQPIGVVSFIRNGWDPNWKPGVPAFSPPMTFESTANSINALNYLAPSYMDGVCGGNLNTYFVNSRLGNMPNLVTALATMGSNDTVTVAAMPGSFPFWPSGENKIGSGPGSSSTDGNYNMTVTFDAAAKFGYPRVYKAFAVIEHNGTTINNGTCFWPSEGNNESCIAFDAGLDPTVNGFYGDTAGMGLSRGAFRIGTATITNSVFANNGCMADGCPEGHNHNIYLGSVMTGGFDKFVADNLASPDVIAKGWNLKLRIANSDIRNSFFAPRVNSGASVTHGPIDFPCGGTHNVTFSALAANPFSHNWNISGQSSTFLVQANEEDGTNAATIVAGGLNDGRNCPTTMWVPSSVPFAVNVQDGRNFTTTSDPTALQITQTHLWDLAAGKMINSYGDWDHHVNVNSVSAPVAGVYSLHTDNCYEGEGTIPYTNPGRNIYDCFGDPGAGTFYATGGLVPLLTNTPTTASISVPIDPRPFGIAVGDSLFHSVGFTTDALTVSSITGAGPFTISMTCPAHSATGPNCIGPNFNIETVEPTQVSMWKTGPIEVTASTTGSGCDNLYTLCGIAYNPRGMQVNQGEQVIGNGIASFDCVVAGKITFVMPFGGSSGSGYAVGNTITLAGGTTASNAIVTVASVGGGGAVTSVTILSGGVYTAIPKLFTQGSTSGSGTGATFQFPKPEPIINGSGSNWQIRVSQPSGAPCTNTPLTNQVYQLKMPTTITFDHNLIGWDGVCPFGGQCTVLDIAQRKPWQRATITNSIIWTDVAGGGPTWGSAGANNINLGMTDGGGNILCNNRVDLSTSARCAIPPFTAASFTGSIAGTALAAPSGATACRPGMYVWDNSPQGHVGESGVTLSGTRIASGSAPNFVVSFPPGGVFTTDVPIKALNCGWGTPSSAFNGQISGGGTLTINSGLVGSVHIGDYVTDSSGTLPDNIKITGGSGTSWTTTYSGAGVAAESMVSVR